MKRTLNILGIIGIVMIFAACASMKKTKGRYHINIYMSEEEQKEWHTYKDTIYHDSVAVGVFQSNEWEYSDNKLVLEISIRTLNYYEPNTMDIIRYVHARQPKAKIEVNTDGRREE
jgi:hypothetical protein